MKRLMPTAVVIGVMAIVCALLGAASEHLTTIQILMIFFGALIATNAWAAMK